MTNPRVPRKNRTAEPRSLRRNAAATLLKGDAGYRLMIESIRDHAIFMLDSEGVVTNWNAGAERINGFSSDQILGKHFSIFYPQEDRRRNWRYKVPRTTESTRRKAGIYARMEAGFSPLSLSSRCARRRVN